MTTPLKEAIDLAGGAASVAAYFGIRPVSVYEWIRRGYVPAEKCPEIEKMSNGAACCEALNGHVDWAFVRSSNTSALPNSTPAPSS
jgi:DNA-binding transcriptional regulator YdaS (Cro superfamily)